jgi:iron-sulfur cluster repair protein YtfE (RIC family)
MSHSCSCGCQGAPATVTIGNGSVRRPRGEETVGAVAGRSSRARQVVQQLGFDLCCGSGLTLRQAAAARGLDLETVLRALDEAGA